MCCTQEKIKEGGLIPLKISAYKSVTTKERRPENENIRASADEIGARPTRLKLPFVILTTSKQHLRQSEQEQLTKNGEKRETCIKNHVNIFICKTVLS